MTEYYEKTFDIGVSQSDCFGKLKVSELFKFMQECAMTHAELMGVGMDEMLKLDSIFVLSRMKINIHSMASYGEKITIKTYPVGIERLFYIREFEISSGPTKVAEARSQWIVIDLKSRRPLRNRDFGKDFPKYLNPGVSIENPVKLVLPDGMEEVFVRKVGYSDLDILGHANNSVYIAWTCDCVGSDFFRDNKTYSITINYSSELSDGEYVRIIGENLSIKGINESGRESFSARIERL